MDRENCGLIEHGKWHRRRPAGVRRFARTLSGNWLFITAGLGAILQVAPAAAQSVPASGAVTRNATAQVVIVTPLSFNKVRDLNFGTIIPGKTAGTIVLSPFDTRTTTGGTRIAGASAQSASFAGYGARNQLVTIRISSNAVNLIRAGGTQTMRVDTFVIGSTPTANLTTSFTQFRIASTTGVFQFPVGATLRVNANQAPGSYSGSFSITLNYL